MGLSFAVLLAAAASACAPVEGADRLWLPATHWVIVGELHGTNETPDAFTNLVCLAASSGRPVTVALEYSADWQPVINAYLNSDGGADARAALLTLPVWQAEMQDGRGSIAFLQMLDRLRRMKMAGRIVGVIGSDVGGSTPSGQTRDAAMAQAWTAIPTAENGIILALVGNVHAMRKAMVRPERTIVTAGSLMPSARTITVNVVGNGGKAWNCQADGCQEHDNGVPRQASAGIVIATDADYPWSATYELGRLTTAASPAIPVVVVP
ncbi:MAG: hypothetical protein ABI740_10935, partial [Alphaproteobacteria bacterium]